MITLLKNILNDLEYETIENVIKHGKYSIHGFRVGGKKSVPKRKMMENELLSNDNRAFDDLCNYANSQVSEKHLDNLWTFPEEISEETLFQKLQDNRKEKGILELISNKRYDYLNKIYLIELEADNNRLQSKETEKINKLNKYVYDESKINELRKIIIHLEEKVNNLEMNKNSLEEEQQKSNKEINRLASINIKRSQEILKLKNENSSMSKKINEYQQSYDLLNENLNEKEKIISKMGVENKQIPVLIFGNKSAEEWFRNKNSGKFNFTCISDITDYTKLYYLKYQYQEIWIVDFQLRNEEKNKIFDTPIYTIYNNINRLRYFQDFIQIEKYMRRLEVII